MPKTMTLPRLPAILFRPRTGDPVSLSPYTATARVDRASGPVLIVCLFAPDGDEIPALGETGRVEIEKAGGGAEDFPATVLCSASAGSRRERCRWILALGADTPEARALADAAFQEWASALAKTMARGS